MPDEEDKKLEAPATATTIYQAQSFFAKSSCLPIRRLNLAGTSADTSSSGVDVSNNAADISTAQSTAATAGDSVSENLSSAQSAAGAVSDPNAAQALTAAQVSAGRIPIKLHDYFN